jgi:hypothetical protein
MAETKPECIERLTTELPELAPLTEDEIQALTEMARATLAQRSAELDVAIDQALSHLPTLLRGPAKKILFG